MNFDFIQSCRKLIQFDCSPQHSTAEAVQFLEQLAKDLGLFCEVQNEIQDGVPQSNILIRCQPFEIGDQEFLLQSHLDTADPGNFANWKKNSFNPFDAVIEQGHIYGLGAAEVKLDFLCKLKAMAQIKDQKFKNLKPVLVGTFGEETGMQGALKLIRKNKINAKYALIGEPTDLKIVNSAKGFATVEIKIPLSLAEQKFKSEKAIAESYTTKSKIFSGKSAHSSTPQLGDSAALKMFDFVRKLKNEAFIFELDCGTRVNTIPNQAMIEFDETSVVENSVTMKLKKLIDEMEVLQNQMKEILDPDFEPHFSTLSVGIVRTKSDHILIGGSCRILPSVTQEVYEKWMNSFQTACVQLGVEFKLLDYKRPFRTPEDSVFVKAAQSELKKWGLDSRCYSIPSTNEASLFSRINIECLCLGAGKREGNVHTSNECVNIEDLERSSQFYFKMMERFCL